VQAGSDYERLARTADVAPGHFTAFAAFDEAHTWLTLRDRGYSLLETLQRQFAPQTGLFPDFAWMPSSPVPGSDSSDPAASSWTRQTDPVPATVHGSRGAVTEGFVLGTDAAYGWNAGLVPLLLGSQFALTGDPRAAALLEPLERFLQNAAERSPERVANRYSLDGVPMTGSDAEPSAPEGSGPDDSTLGTPESAGGTPGGDDQSPDAQSPDMESGHPAIVGPLGVGALAGTQSDVWVQAVWDHLVSAGEESSGEDYYADTLRVLSLVILSGNWWAPQPRTEDCP
jgi:hypothetical protein